MSKHRQVVRIDREAVARLRGPLERAEQAVGNLNGRAALAADEVPVACRREVISGRALSEADLLDHPEAFQLVEIAVDR